MVCGRENNPETIKNAVQTNANHSSPVKDGRIERNSKPRDPPSNPTKSAKALKADEKHLGFDYERLSDFIRFSLFHS